MNKRLFYKNINNVLLRPINQEYQSTIFIKWRLAILNISKFY